LYCCPLVTMFIVPGETLITRLTTQRWLDVGEQWTEDEYRSSHSVMRYEYRVTCDAHYYGAGCANLCRPRDDNFGHYKCSPTGDRVCLSGWQGDYCTKRKCYASCHLVSLIWPCSLRMVLHLRHCMRLLVFVTVRVHSRVFSVVHCVEALKLSICLRNLQPFRTLKKSQHAPSKR
jgi:hypothetical protein